MHGFGSKITGNRAGAGVANPLRQARRPLKAEPQAWPEYALLLPHAQVILHRGGGEPGRRS